MSVFSGKDGEFIMQHAIEKVQLELLEGRLAKRKAYAIAKGAPNNENVQNAALAKILQHVC